MTGMFAAANLPGLRLGPGMMLESAMSQTSNKESPRAAVRGTVGGTFFDRCVPRSVVVFRALQVGDTLCAVPALRALRQRLPRARITLVGLPWARQLVERLSREIDEFIAFPGHPALPERACDPHAYRAFVHCVQARRFELALQLHGSGIISNGIITEFETRWQAGFCKLEADASRAWFPYPDSGHEIRRLLALTTHLGAPPCGEGLSFLLNEEDEGELARAGLAGPLSGPAYACLHVGARDEKRRWPLERFAELADALAARGLRIVLTGSEHEHTLIQAVAGAMRAPAFDAAGAISLGAMAVLMRGARLLVSNDTGVSHLAVALGLPSVVIFRASDIRRWAPLDSRLHQAVQDPEGIRGQAVLARALQLMAREAQPW
jgi:ADP-heptose:LPS heptosyltransferase